MIGRFIDVIVTASAKVESDSNTNKGAQGVSSDVASVCGPAVGMLLFSRWLVTEITLSLYTCRKSLAAVPVFWWVVVVVLCIESGWSGVVVIYVAK